MSGRGLIPPPITAELLLAVVESSSVEDVDACVGMAARADRPLSYFLALFEADGTRKGPRKGSDAAERERRERKMDALDAEMARWT